ncbi:MAG: HEAT repeat domain-containing protein [Nitrosomonas sp. PRO4]|nr:HEAT repeat domain-containing protein [Nitrosomonas sp. PRO4]
MLNSLYLKTVLSVMLMIFALTVMSARQIMADDGNQLIFNSLESFQVNCFASDGAAQQYDQELAVNIQKQAASEDSGERIGALSQLAVKDTVDPAIVQKILQKALMDKDGNVRAQAVHALAQQDCADAMLVLEQALNDSELAVRLMALDSLSLDDRSMSLLKQALEDDNEAVREMAAMKIEALSADSPIQ